MDGLEGIQCVSVIKLEADLESMVSGFVKGCRDTLHHDGVRFSCHFEQKMESD